ncbi:MAG: hypothetical protein QME25_01430, partial [Bacteroidota bacterium]|nr:hypothetical protein [Bacteroidota bacterium]
FKSKFKIRPLRGRTEQQRLNNQIWLKRIVIFGLPVIVLIFYLSVIAHFDYTTDDTYIYLQFAKNITSGNGFAFNAGELTYGTTSPLWTLVISLGGYFGLDFLLTAKIIDIVAACCAIVVFFLLAVEILKHHIVALLATLAFSLNAWFVRWSATGMETSIAVLLTLLVILYSLKKDYLVAIIFVALLNLIRPETFLLTILVFVNIFINTIDKKRATKIIGVGFLLFGVVLLPWLVFAYLNFGTIIPNTAMAKAGLGFKLDDFQWTFTDLFKTLLITEALTFFIVIIGFIFLLLDSFKSRDWLRVNILPISWAFGLILLYLLTQANIISRYLLLIIPVFIIYSFWFTIFILNKFKLERFIFSVLFLLTTLIMLQNQFLFHKYVKTNINSFTDGMRECFIPIGNWLRENTPEDATVFIPDVGAVGYYSQRRICDAAGLVSPQILKYLRSGMTYQNLIENKIYSKVCKSDYLVHRSNKPNDLIQTDLEPLFYKTVFGLGLSNMETAYYTVYKVNNKKE